MNKAWGRHSEWEATTIPGSEAREQTVLLDLRESWGGTGWIAPRELLREGGDHCKKQGIGKRQTGTSLCCYLPVSCWCIPGSDLISCHQATEPRWNCAQGSASWDTDERILNLMKTSLKCHFLPKSYGKRTSCWRAPHVSKHSGNVCVRVIECSCLSKWEMHFPFDLVITFPGIYPTDTLANTWSDL